MKRIRKTAAYYLFLHDDNDIFVKLWEAKIRAKRAIYLLRNSDYQKYRKYLVF